MRQCVQFQTFIGKLNSAHYVLASLMIDCHEFGGGLKNLFGQKLHDVVTMLKRKCWSILVVIEVLY